MWLQITNSVGKIHYPAAVDDNTIFTLSDQRHNQIFFRYDRASKFIRKSPILLRGLK